MPPGAPALPVCAPPPCFGASGVPSSRGASAFGGLPPQSAGRAGMAAPDTMCICRGRLPAPRGALPARFSNGRDGRARELGLSGLRDSTWSSPNTQAAGAAAASFQLAVPSLAGERPPLLSAAPQVCTPWGPTPDACITHLCLCLTKRSWMPPRAPSTPARPRRPPPRVKGREECRGCGSQPPCRARA
ncbi:MAG: hypothetical protein J3K34DRAFT_63968 [Monoraphidium minutum]|nr:MAG: hypothetical protein J3K34DRAFT_63968 [Monoraphidium minutum]